MSVDGDATGATGTRQSYCHVAGSDTEKKSTGASQGRHQLDKVVPKWQALTVRVSNLGPVLTEAG